MHFNNSEGGKKKEKKKGVLNFQVNKKICPDLLTPAKWDCKPDHTTQ